MRTSADGVYAIGDLVHGPALAHKASDEGIIAVEDAAGLQTHPLSYDDIPARDVLLAAGRELRPHRGARRRSAAADVVVGKFPMGGVGAATVYGDRKGMVKIVGDRTLRRAARRQHRRRARDRDDRRAGRREAARGRLRGDRAHGPPAPDVLGGGDGGGARHGRLGHPRLVGVRSRIGDSETRLRLAPSFTSTSARLTPSWRPSGSTRCCPRPPVWQPILLGGLFKIHDRDSWARRDGRDDGHARGRAAGGRVRAAAGALARSVAGQHAARDAGRDVRDADRQGGRRSRWRPSARRSRPAAT